MVWGKLEPELERRLIKAAREMRLTRSAIVRMAINQFLNLREGGDDEEERDPARC